MCYLEQSSLINQDLLKFFPSKICDPWLIPCSLKSPGCCCCESWLFSMTANICKLCCKWIWSKLYWNQWKDSHWLQSGINELKCTRRLGQTGKLKQFSNRISKSLYQNVKNDFGLNKYKSEAHLISFEKTLFQMEEKIRANQTWTHTYVWRAPNIGKCNFGIRKA